MLAERAPDLRSLPTEAVAQRCRAEAAELGCDEWTADACALELLRRALNEGDVAAWRAFAARYRALVLSTVKRQPVFALVHEDENFWVDRTLERFWSAAGRHRLHRFPNMPAVLRYLRLCARSVLLDEVRARRPTRHVCLADGEESGARVEYVESMVLGKVAAHELWRVILAELQTEPERLVARLSLVAGLSPRHIQARYPDRYADVGQVYRIKRNVFDRLRRSARVQAFLS